MCISNILVKFIDFFSKKKRLNISMPIKSEQKQESDATIQKVEDDRGLSIQVHISAFR